MHDLYFEPKYEEFRSRTIWSLSNAFTSAFKELEPIPQFKAAAKLGEFLESRFPSRSDATAVPAGPPPSSVTPPQKSGFSRGSLRGQTKLNH